MALKFLFVFTVTNTTKVLYKKDIVVVVPKECMDYTNRIVAAAIKKRGIVFTGVRHGLIIKDMVDVGFLVDPKTDYVYEREQGFIDSNGRFLRRDEARDVALAARQIDKTKHKGLLYSEDLW